LSLPDDESEEYVNINYGTGSLIGRFAIDKVCVKSLCIDNQTFIAVTDESDDPFQYLDFDGILGVGLPKLSAVPEANFLKNLGETKKSIFSVFLAEHKHDFESSIFLGGYKESLFEFSTLKYYKLNNDSYWSIPLSDVMISGKSLGFCDGDCQVILDTGSSTIVAPFGEFFSSVVVD
jgi:hypothetical protein